ncbi:MAG: ATP-binding protein, partial [Oscillospiraceae bacterium]|nr:ATP-binding protein [Oscillospiraceae bacterium]
RHGFPADYLARKHTCAQCEDTGYVRGLRCACFTALLQSLAYQELSMDTPLESSDFARFRLTHYPEAPNGDGVIPRKKMEQILAACRAYASRFHPHAGSLLFTGPTGLGKTHLSLAIAKEVIDKGFTVIYGSAPNLISRMEHEHFSRGRYGEQAGETARALLECTLLILDDLGAEFSTAFTQSCIYNIVNTRLMSAMPVLISTNLSMAQINEKYGERVASRIIGNYQVLRFFGGDVRQILRASSSFEEKGAKRP